MAEELLTAPLALGGKHVEASVMFSDIRSSTSITAALSPADTIELLNSYYTLMFLIDEGTRTGLGDAIRVESHGPAQFKTRSQAARVYSVPAGQRP